MNHVLWDINYFCYLNFEQIEKYFLEIVIYELSKCELRTKRTEYYSNALQKSIFFSDEMLEYVRASQGL